MTTYDKNERVPGVQRIKRSAILNGTIVAEEWKNEGDLSRVAQPDPNLLAFSLRCYHRAVYYITSFYQLNA